MTTPKRNITGILLAGGKSSRMGKEKGFIKVGKRMLYQYPLRILESLCDEILISTCKKLEIEEEYEQVCDEIANIGPIGGIYTCLKRSSNSMNIILSYDLPMISEELIAELLKSGSENDIVLPAMSSDQAEPLCGIYKKDVANILLNQIEKGNFAVHKVLPLVKTKTVLIKHQMPFYHPDLFMNINAESDLNSLPTDLR